MGGKAEQHDLKLLIQSKNPIICIESHEEKRALTILSQISQELLRPFFSWDVVDGLKRVDLAEMFDPLEDTSDPEMALKHILSAKRPSIYALCDFHPYIQDAPQIVRLLKELAMDLNETGHTLVLISHELNIPDEIQRMGVAF